MNHNEDIQEDEDIQETMSLRFYEDQLMLIRQVDKKLRNSEIRQRREDKKTNNNEINHSPFTLTVSPVALNFKAFDTTLRMT